MLVKSEISTTLDGLSLKITPHCWLFTSNLNFQPHPWIYIYIHTFVHHINIYIICSCATTWTTTVPSPRWYSYCYDTRLTKLKSGFVISPLLAGSLLSVSPCHVCCLFIRTCTGYVCLMDSCLFFRSPILQVLSSLLLLSHACFYWWSAHFGWLIWFISQVVLVDITFKMTAKSKIC